MHMAKMKDNSHVQESINEQVNDTAELAQSSASTLETSGPDKSNSSPQDAIPRIKVIQYKGEKVLLPECKDLRRGLDLLGKAIGGGDLSFAQDIMWQLANAASRADGINEETLSFMVAFVIAMKPRDRVKTMLTAQMAAVHVATMDAARNLANAETLQHFDSHERALNKFARTYTTQMDALNRYHPDSEQTVLVQQNVSTRDGGQAIIGNVMQNAATDSKAKTSTSVPAAITHARARPVPTIGESDERAPVLTKTGNLQK